MAKAKPKASQKSTALAAWQACVATYTLLKPKTAFRIAVLWVIGYLTLVSSTLKAFLDNFNYLEIFPGNLVLPLVMHAVTALLIVAALYWLPWLKTFAAKLASVIVLALCMADYDNGLRAVADPIRAFVPGLTSSDSLPIVSLIYLGLLVVLAIVAGIGLERLVIAKVKQISRQDVELGLVVIVLCLFIFPAYSTCKVLPSMIRESRVSAAELPIAGQQGTEASSTKPDIYYIVLDRYTSNSVLKEQFNFSNDAFTGFLRDQGFTVNDTASSNYPFTAMSVASTFNAGYTNNLVAPYKDNAVQSRTLYHNLIRQSAVVKALKQSGYRYYAIGSTYGASDRAPLAGEDYMWSTELSIFGKTKRLRGFEATQFKQSVYYRFAQLVSIPRWPLRIAERADVEYTRIQLATLKNLSTSQQQGGRLVFAHILVPHEPFYYNADGSLSMHPSTDSLGEPVKNKYVEQVKFINSQIQELVSTINTQSNGQAVIILNADEGPYPEKLNDTFQDPQYNDRGGIDGSPDMSQWSDSYLAMKYGILQAVHIPRATQQDLDQLASVNVFRIVLNRYAGSNLDYLPNCHFGLTKGRGYEYDYSDITSRFTVNPDPQCQQFASQSNKKPANVQQGDVEVVE